MDEGPRQADALPLAGAEIGAAAIEDVVQANQLAQGDDNSDPGANKAKGKNSGDRGARPVKANAHRPGRKT